MKKLLNLNPPLLINKCTFYIQYSFFVIILAIWGIAQGANSSDSIANNDIVKPSTAGVTVGTDLPVKHRKLKKYEDINPSDYVGQFTISSQKASELLKPFWVHGNKGKLAQKIGISQATLKSLIEENKTNKALQAFNATLIENSAFWIEIFPTPYAKAQIIFDQLIRDTSVTVVAQQLGISVGLLQDFQMNGKNKDVLKCLPQILIIKWPYETEIKSGKGKSAAVESTDDNLQLEETFHFSLLPAEINIRILSFLPLEDVVVATKTRKTWLGLTNNFDFLSFVFNKTLERVKEVGDDHLSSSEEESLAGYLQEYWISLDNWFSLVPNQRERNLQWSFLQAFISFSQTPAAIIEDLSTNTINFNYPGDIETDLKKLFILGIHAQELLFAFFPDTHRQYYIRRCFTSPQSFIQRVKAVQKHRSSLVPKHKEQDRQIEIISSCMQLTPEKINILAKYVTLGVFKIRIENYNRDEVIQACLELTPQQMEERFEAIHKLAKSIFNKNEEAYVRHRIISIFLSLDALQIAALTKYLPSLSISEEGVERYSTYDQTKIETIKAFSTLTHEQMHAVGEYASILFTKKMKLKEKCAIIKACADLTPEEITKRLSCLQTFKTELFSAEYEERGDAIIAALELTPGQIKVIGNYAPSVFIFQTRSAQKGSFMRACSKLTPEEITAKLENIKKHAPFILDLKKYPYGGDSLINASLDLTLEQIKALEPHGAYLFALSGISDLANEVTEIFKQQTPEEIILRTECLKKHVTSLLPKHNVFKETNLVILAYLKLPLKNMEALATNANWLIKWNLDTTENKPAAEIVQACQDLLSEDLIQRSEYLKKYEASLFQKEMSPTHRAKMMTTYLALPPAHIEAVMVHADWIFTANMKITECNLITKACQNLMPKDVSTQLQHLQNHQGSFLRPNLTDAQKSEIIATCLTLEPEQIDALGNNARSFLDKVDEKGINTIIVACRDLTVEKIELFGQYFSSFSMEDATGDEHAKIIESCKHMTPEELKTKQSAFQKYSALFNKGNGEHRGQSKVVISCLGLTSEQIEAVGTSVCSFFKSYMGDARVSILKSCAPLSSEEITSRGSAIQQYINLLYSRKNAEEGEEREQYVLSDFITKSLQVPAKEITLRAQEIQKHYSSIFSKNLDAHDVNVLHTNLIELTVEQIEAIESLPAFLFTKGMNGENRSEVIRTLTALEPQERAERILNVEKYVVPILLKNMDGYSHGSVVKNCLKLAPSQIVLKAQNILNTLIVFNKRLYRIQQAMMINNMLELLSEQISALTEYISLPAHKDIEPSKLDRIIGECNELTPEQIVSGSAFEEF